MKENLLARLEKQMVETKEVVFKFNKTQNVVVEIDTKFLNNTVESFITEFYIFVDYMQRNKAINEFLRIFEMLVIKYFSKIKVDGEVLDFLTISGQTDSAFKQLLDYYSALNNIEDMKNNRLRDVIVSEMNKNKNQLEKIVARLKKSATDMSENQDDIMAMMLQLDTLNSQANMKDIETTRVVEEVIEDASI